MILRTIYCVLKHYGLSNPSSIDSPPGCWPWFPESPHDPANHVLCFEALRAIQPSTIYSPPEACWSCCPAYPCHDPANHICFVFEALRAIQPLIHLQSSCRGLLALQVSGPCSCGPCIIRAIQPLIPRLQRPPALVPAESQYCHAPGRCGLSNPSSTPLYP